MIKQFAFMLSQKTWSQKDKRKFEIRRKVSYTRRLRYGVLGYFVLEEVGHVE